MYKCKKCNWEGSEAELDFEAVDTCFGGDKTEVCPKCGSMEVYYSIGKETNKRRW